jgi:hypothetical protein
MKTELKIGLISFSILLGLSLIIFLIIHLTTKDSKKDSNACDASSEIQNGTIGDCTSTLIDGTTCYPICNSGYTLSGNRTCNNGSLSTASCNPNTPSSGCATTCGTGKYCDGNNCVTNSNYLDINSQPANTIQLANNTSDNYLHIFIQCTNINQKWDKQSGDGTIYSPINWGTLRDPGNKDSGNYAWDPVGAVILVETIIPKDKFIILNLPPDIVTFIIQPIKMQDSNNNVPLKIGDIIDSKIIPGQSPVLFEATKNLSQSGVADISGVNGLNFKVKYEVTTAKGIKNMEIQKNPCERISDKFKTPNAGCWSPVKKICGGSPTCDCKDKTQNCKLNDCSKKLFTIPENLQQYYNNYDNAGGPISPNNDYTHYPEYVKPFINNNKNIIKDSDQDKYCDDIQFNSGDYTTYCYDYNDLKSSPIWANPFQAKLVYSDL